MAQNKVYVSTRIASYAAHLPVVRREVHREGQILFDRASARFAPHNHPGGHELDLGFGITDAEVSLSGPAPLSVEYGRSPDVNGNDGMHGLHILGLL